MAVKISASYIGDDKVELVHGPSGSKIVTDLPEDNGGRGRLFSPTDLAAASVASCVLSIMAKLAAREGIKFEGASFEIEKHMQQDPRRIARFTGVIKLPPGITDVQREKLRACIKACPVTRSLHPEIKMEISAQ